MLHPITLFKSDVESNGNFLKIKLYSNNMFKPLTYGYAFAQAETF